MTTTDVTAAMSTAEIIDLTKRHTIFSWSAQASVNPIAMVRGEGIYFWDADGKRYLDMNSQLMCVNIGHGDKRVIRSHRLASCRRRDRRIRLLRILDPLPRRGRSGGYH